jgi:hypothetical protein
VQDGQAVKHRIQEKTEEKIIPWGALPHPTAGHPASRGLEPFQSACAALKTSIHRPEEAPIVLSSPVSPSNGKHFRVEIWTGCQELAVAAP